MVFLLGLLGAAPADMADLRGLGVGTAAAALPRDPFAGFACVDAPGHAVEGWTDWSACPADAAGLHAVRFGYAQGDTKVAGHPVLLTASFGPDGRLDALRIATDPKAPLFLRKKAFLLGLQARHRWGDEDWSCARREPRADAQPVGGVFVDETCTKHAPGRTVVVDRHLFTPPGADLKAFVGDSVVTITAAP